MYQFKLSILVWKTLAILATGGVGALTGTQVLDILTQTGVVLSPEQALVLAWAFTSGVPAAYVALKNFLKNSHTGLKLPTWVWKVLPVVLVCLVPLVLMGCVTTTSTNPDGSTTVTKDLSPWAQELAKQSAPIVIAFVQDALDDTPKPLTEQERFEMQQNAAFRTAFLQAVVEQLQWSREHPGENLPKALKDKLEVLRSPTNPEGVSNVEDLSLSSNLTLTYPVGTTNTALNDLPTTTLSCEHCGKQMVPKYANIMLTSSPPQQPWHWWCACGARKDGGVVVEKTYDSSIRAAWDRANLSTSSGAASKP